MTSTFDPANIRERDDHCMSQSVQLNQLAATQLELRELRTQTDALHDRVLEETRHADRAENELQLLRLMQEQQGQHHH